MTQCLESLQVKRDEITQNVPIIPQKPGNTFFYELDLKQDHVFHTSCAIEEVLGYSSKEVMQNGLKWFVDQIHPEDLIRLNHLADQQRHSPIIPRIHYRFKTKNGGFCFVREHRDVLYDSNGVPSFLIGQVEKV